MAIDRLFWGNMSDKSFQTGYAEIALRSDRFVVINDNSKFPSRDHTTTNLRVASEFVSDSSLAILIDLRQFFAPRKVFSYLFNIEQWKNIEVTGFVLPKNFWGGISKFLLSWLTVFNENLHNLRHTQVRRYTGCFFFTVTSMNFE